MRKVIPLLLVAITAAGCGTTSASTPVVPSTEASVTSGGPIDVCKYLTQADAESMLGVPTGPGKLEHILPTDSTCAYTPKTPTVTGTRVALTINDGDFAGETVSEFQGEYENTRPVDGLGFPAARNADGAVFAAQDAKQDAKRGCTLIMSIKKPTDPDAFAKQVAAVCRKAFAG